MTSKRFGQAIVGFAALLNIFAATGLAQNVKNTDYSPDKALKSNARINPSTLAMEMSIPLIGYAGRAGNGMPVSISYSSKVWGMQNYGSQWFNGNEDLVNDVRPQFAKNSAAGWSSSLGTVRVDFSWDPYHAAYSYPEFPYGLRPETEGQIWIPTAVSSEENNDLFYVKRVQVLMPDGSSHEFRSSDTPIGCGTIVEGGCTGTDFTGTFLSVDGSRMRFESGTNSSTLYLPNGSRYVFGAPTGSLNLATTFYDVHGNKMTYNTTDRKWTDTLGRVIEDPLPNNWNGVQNQTVQNDTVTFPGFNSGNYNVVFSWLELEDALLNPSDALRFIGRRACNGSAYTLLSPYLFEDGSETNTRLCNLGPEFNPVVLSKVTLPNGQFYEFKYNVFGEITKVIYPSGAYERFVYSRITSLSPGNYAYDEANRGVTERYVSEKGDGTDEVEWNYAAPGGTGLNPYYVTTTAPDGSYSQQYIHMDSVRIPSKPYGFSDANAGRAYDERSYDSNDVLRARKLTTWEETGPLSGGHSAARRDMRPTKEVSMIFEPGDSNALATMSETVYDTTGNSDAAYFSSLNPKRTKTYHYVVVNASTAASANIATAAGWFSAATPATVTEVDYLYDANYKARNINGLVTETRVKDASGNVKAKSQITYDGLSLVDETESTRWENPSSNYRGLVTKTRSWHDIANNLYIDTQAQYDLMGNLRYSWDGNGNLSQVEYSSTYDYAYPTKTISPIPDSSGTYGLNDELETTTTFDYNTGLPLTMTDPNGAVSEMQYNDPLLRPTKVIAPNDAETITEYGAGTGPSTRWVKVSTQIDATNWKEAISWFDGLGRGYLSQSIDDELDDVFAVTCYDNMGRVSKSSNPIRASSAPTCTSSLEWTTPGYDLIGRTITVTTPDSSVVETAYSLATSGSQIGTVVTAEDQAGKLRRSVTNALGQLKRVDEPTTSGLGAISSPNQDTVYAYDLLGNLTTVTQGAQTRTFTYDTLSRLKSAANPESGTINYTYDANGNLATKIDARTITTTYTYDRLNRVTLRAYTNEPSGSETHDVTYYYDNLTNGKGKLKKVTSAVSTTEYTAYDILGRVTAHKQTTDSMDYTTGYTFDLAGNLLEQTYPGGRVVKNTLDSDGALSQVQSKKSGATYLNYANGFNYNAAGAATSMKLGNGLWETTQFNSRLQPTQIGLGLGSATPNKLKLAYSYGTTTNNGNVMSQTITVPGVTYPFVQTYTHDELNRISNAEELQNSVQTWEQTFIYDRYGNRNFDEANTTTLAKNCGSSPNFTVCAADRKVVNPAVNTANNRLSTSDDYIFDNAGNTTEDALGRTFVYDAENKQIEVIDNSVTVGEYSYDGDGKRIKKHVPATGELTVFVYNAAGKLIQEHSSIVQTGGNAKTVYTTNDHLGSPRINTDATGQVISRHDYHPYGDEVTRTGYGSDTIRKQFTGYERDGETDLDFAEARMFSSSVGRFTVPDPAMISASLQNPQTWNRYPYVLNNPLKYSDPLGLWKINRVVHMKKDKDKKDTNKVDYVEYLLEAEEGDDLNTLKDQFNLKKDKAANLMADLQKNGMRLSKVDDYAISTIFGEIERIEKDYEQDIRDKGGKEAANKNGADCSMTTARLSFRDASRTMTTDELKAYAESLPNPNRKPEGAKTGDAVLWMKNNQPTHFATFLKFNRSGEPEVYSKTGSTGPYEIEPTRQISGANPNFGTVTNYFRGRP